MVPPTPRRPETRSRTSSTTGTHPALSVDEQLSQARGANLVLEGQVERGTQELKEAVEELEAFAYSVSHDLRAPLRAISGFSELLVREAHPALDDRSIFYLNRIHQNCAHMATLIDDLLEFSRVGRSALAEQDVDVDVLLRGCLQELAEGDRGDLPRVELEPLPRCRGDWRLVKQVFTNLLSNAVKYSRDATPPRIKVSAVRSAGSAEVVYAVADNGVGFDMAHAPQLFQVFQRLHRAEDYEGTGVGLALCHRIVSRHGGRIWAEAEVGRGATFFVALPEGRCQI